MHDHFSTPCGFDENGHPCPKPVRYATWLVSRGAGKGQSVLDPFMGSGTTGVACMNLGRLFIGVEKEPAYFRHRLRAHRERPAAGKAIRVKSPSATTLKLRALSQTAARRFMPSRYSVIECQANGSIGSVCVGGTAISVSGTGF